MKQALVICFCLCWCGCHLESGSGHKTKTWKDWQRLSIVFSGNLWGELEEVGETKQLGGLARRVTWLETERQRGPLLTLEAGDAFTRSWKEAWPQSALMARARLIVDVFNQSGLDAYGLGERDFALGKKGLQELTQTAHFPFMAANILQVENQTPVFREVVVKTVGNFNIGITALLSQRTGIEPIILEQLGWTISDPVGASKKVMSQIEKQKIDFLILLGQLSPMEEKQVSEVLTNLKFIFGSHSADRSRTPECLINCEQEPSAWFLDAGSRGRYLGWIELFRPPGQMAMGCWRFDMSEKSPILPPKEAITIWRYHLVALLDSIRADRPTNTSIIELSKRADWPGKEFPKE